MSPVTDLHAIDCIAYCRVSTEQQAGEDRTSLVDQRAAIEQLAAKLGRTVGAWFVDPGASGATIEKRPGMRSLLAACEAAPRSASRAGLVLVLNDSRFGRFPDPEESTYWRQHLKRHGWIVRFAENDDSENLTVRSVMRAIVASQATQKREDVRANAKRGGQGTAAQGYWGTRPPYGYRRKVVAPAGRERILENGARKAIDEKVILVPHAEEAAVVRALFERYARGADSLASLVEWLLVETPGRKWTRPAVRFTLTNPAYVGDVVFGRTPADHTERQAARVRPESEWTVREGAHEPIVSRQLFADVQARLALHRRRTRGVRSDWILSGLVLCRCGRHFAAGGGGGRRKDGPRIAVYRCVTRGAHPSGRCAYPGTVNKVLLEGAFLDTLTAVVGAPRAQRRLIHLLDRKLAQIREAPTDSAAKVVQHIRALEAKRDRLVGAIAAGTLTDFEARGQLAEVRAALAQAEARRETILADATRAQVLDAERDRLVALALDLPRMVQALHGPALREVIRPWIRRAVFNTETRELWMEIRHLPALGTTNDTGDSYSMPRHARQKHDLTEPVTVRRVRVGRGQ